MSEALGALAKHVLALSRHKRSAPDAKDNTCNADEGAAGMFVPWQTEKKERACCRVSFWVVVRHAT